MTVELSITLDPESVRSLVLEACSHLELFNTQLPSLLYTVVCSSQHHFSWPRILGCSRDHLQRSLKFQRLLSTSRQTDRAKTTPVPILVMG